MDFRNGKFNEIPENFFFNYKNVMNFAIYDCGLIEITLESFKSAKKLIFLVITENQIKTLNSKIFNDCENLVVLDLSKNLIENISSDVFKSIGTLESLNLSENRIKTMEKIIFSNLKRLFLSDNQIETFNGNNLNLSEVKLNDNLITSLKIDESLKTLHAENNQISNIIVDENNHLSDIRLRNNSLTDLRNISKLTKLIFLDLSDNKIEVQMNFKNLPKLERLLLQNTNIFYTPEIFTELSVLEFLDISRNNRTIDDLSFLKPLQSLEGLDVQQGAIVNYNFDEIIKIIPKIRTVAIKGESWQVDYNPISYEERPISNTSWLRSK